MLVSRICTIRLRDQLFDAMLETLAGVVERDGRAHMIDNTVVRARYWAVGIKRNWYGRSAWPITRRSLHQTPCPLRFKRSPARLRADTRPGA